MLNLYSTTSGVRSVLLGENEIVGQVKAAYERAIDEDTIKSNLHFIEISLKHVIINDHMPLSGVFG